MPDEVSGFKRIDKYMNFAGAVAALIATVGGVFVKLSLDAQTVQVEAIKKKLQEAENVRQERKLDHDLAMNVYNQINDIYKTTDIKQEQLINRLSAVSALVVNLPDRAVRDRLQESIRFALNYQISKGGESSRLAQIVKSDIDIISFRSDSEGAAAPSVTKSQIEAVAKSLKKEAPKWGGLNFNMFWCEDSSNPDASLSSASSALSLKALDQSATGQWRLRMLPKAVNDQPGYGIKRNIIRASSESELAIGRVLKEMLAERGVPGFEVVQVNYPSPASISLFFCN